MELNLHGDYVDPRGRTFSVENTVVTLDGITVMCGYSETGKSAICAHFIYYAYCGRGTPDGTIPYMYKPHIAVAKRDIFAEFRNFVKDCKQRNRTFPDAVGLLIWQHPENCLHPAEQLELARLICKKCNNPHVRVLITTHSTYFLRAIEVFSERYGVSKRCHYYKTEPPEYSEGGQRKLYRLRNVDGNTKLIYRDFYMPLEEL